MKTTQLAEPGTVRVHARRGRHDRPGRGVVFFGALCGLLVVGCRPDLGPCDEAAARTVVYTDDVIGAPAYAGQALVEVSCGGQASLCHASRAEGASRYGAPGGVDFDLTVLVDAIADRSTDALARGQRQVYRLRYDVVRQVEAGSMPPARRRAEFLEAHALYRGLPSIDSSEGQQILRNWLACGAPLVERTTPTQSPTTVGAVVAPSPCPSPATEACGGATCVDVLADPANCGACGNVCIDAPNTCTQGACDCPAGRVRDPGGVCRDLSTDAGNCGALGRACPPGAVCVGGDCVCPVDTLEACATGCVDLTTDSRNCAGCGLACPLGASCVGATCTCAAGLTACLSGCVDTQTDVAHCGACDRGCNPGEVCFGGSCLAGGCPGGTTDCGGSCVDVTQSASHCGGCGMACTLAGSTCIGSACACAPQSPPLTACADGCVDTASSPTHCGGCGVVCPAGSVCNAGACVCPGGNQSLCSTGCVDTSVDVLHCGGCEQRCATNASCATGRCTCDDPALTHCSGRCVDTQNDASHCGACGRACPAGQFCAAGTCTGVSFQNDILRPIFLTTCVAAGCHGGRRPAANMSLEAGSAYTSLLGAGGGAPSDECTNPARLRVAPGNPDASYLLDKLYGVNLCQGNPMPKVGESLLPSQLERIRAWIAAGAPNN